MVNCEHAYPQTANMVASKAEKKSIQTFVKDIFRRPPREVAARMRKGDFILLEEPSDNAATRSVSAEVQQGRTLKSSTGPCQHGTPRKMKFKDRQREEGG